MLVSRFLDIAYGIAGLLASIGWLLVLVLVMSYERSRRKLDKLTMARLSQLEAVGHTHPSQPLMAGNGDGGGKS
jgi:hypothetical protein